MSMFSNISAIMIGLAVTVPAQAEAVDCPDPAASRVEVEKTIHGFFDALRQEDKAPFRQLTTDAFYAFDVGERFDDSTLVDAVRDALDDGLEINWTLGPMDTRIRCDVAWSQWENTGSVGKAPDLQPVRWLEPAVLIHDDGKWKLDFFHSQRAKPE